MRRWRIDLALAAGLMTAGSGALAGDACGEFQPLSGTVAGMSLVDHTVFADPGLGASISYSGDDGVLTYSRYDLGFDRISERTLLLATERSLEEVSIAVLLLNGEIVRVRQSGTRRLVNEVEVDDVVIVSRHGNGMQVDILGIGTDGDCLHRVHYMPKMNGVGQDGRNGEGLLAFERFERALDDLAVYFCREGCLTEL
jgi:hypothetical protein